MRRVHSFTRLVTAFNGALEEHFPLRPYRDSRGRSRVAGRARRARALVILQELLRRQRRRPTVYVGYLALGRACHRSRSTVYRGVVDLRTAQLLGVEAGGGQTYDACGNLVNAANGYSVPVHLRGRATKHDRKPRQEHRPRNQNTPGERLAREILDRHRESRGP